MKRIIFLIFLFLLVHANVFAKNNSSAQKKCVVEFINGTRYVQTTDVHTALKSLLYLNRIPVGKKGGGVVVRILCGNKGTKVPGKKNKKPLLRTTRRVKVVKR